MARKLKASGKVEAETAEVNENDVTVAAGDSTETETLASDVAADDNASAGSIACGSILRESRTTQGLTTQTVAKQLRLSSTQIEALEQDDFSALPEPTIVKGFIRNYAKLLKTPAEPILAGYAELMPAKELYAFAVKPSINMKITERGRSGSSWYLILAVLLLIVFGIWFFYQSYIQKPDIINPMPEVSEVLPEALALQMPVPAEQAVEMPTANDIIQNESAESTEELERNEAETAASSAVVEADAEMQEDENVNTTSALDRTRVEFNAAQETWLSIINASGKEVYNKILYAGNRDVVDISQPLEIVVGNAHGATLAVDGKPIDLAPHVRGNVARVRLEQ